MSCVRMRELSRLRTFSLSTGGLFAELIEKSGQKAANQKKIYQKIFCLNERIGGKCN
jgi:hypothetical protein